MTIDDLCQFLKVGRTFVDELVKKKRIGFYQIGNGSRRQLRFDMQEHVKPYLESTNSGEKTQPAKVADRGTVRRRLKHVKRRNRA